MPAMEGDDGGSIQAGDRAVGAVGAERDLRKRKGVALSMRPHYHTPAAPSPLPPQSLPLRRMLCSPGIQHSRRIQLSRKGSACGGASSGGFAVGRGLRGGEGAGLRYRYRHPRRRTVDYRQTMGLGVAMKRLKAHYRLANDTYYDAGPDSEDEYDERDSDSEFVNSNFSYIVVNTMPHHLLSHPVAFKQLLRRKIFRPSFDLSGPFSRKPIRAMQAGHVR